MILGQRFAPAAPMTRQTLTPGGLTSLLLACLLAGTLTAISFWLGRNLPSVRGPSAGVGIMATLIGSGVVFWFSTRGGGRGLLVLALYSLLPLAFWSWAVYNLVHA